MTTTTINQFPVEVQNDIKETLKNFIGVYVFRENGEFRTSIGIALTGEDNADDYKCWYYRNSDVYTEAEIDQYIKDMPEINW
jgi:hypothetical protein